MDIQELLEKRDTLTEIAAILYGDDYITKEEFWGSPTEKEMEVVEKKLITLGHEDEVPEEMQVLAQIIFDDLVQRGLIDWGNEEEEDEEI